MTPIAIKFAVLALQAQQLQAAGVDPNDAIFQGALSQIATQQTLFLQLNGSITYRNKVTPMVSNLYWSTVTTTTTPLVQVDLESYVKGVLVKRIVGDGNTLWSYDLSLHQYSATAYGGTAGLPRPETYTSDLLNDVNWAASGSDAYLTKLLRQIYSTTNSTYSSWMPGVMSTALQQDLPVTDPINPQWVYMSVPTDNYYMYNGAPKRTIVFELLDSTSSTGGGLPTTGLKNVFVSQAETVNRFTRLTSLQITPVPGFTFTPDLFQPYTGAQIQGWRPVVAPKPAGH